MDYIFVFTLFILSVMLHIMLKISSLRKDFPTLSFKEVWNTFFQQNWDTLIASGVVLILYEVVLFIVAYNQVPYPWWFDNIGMYVLAAILGWQGQRLFYKYMDSATAALEKKADQLKDKADGIQV